MNSPSRENSEISAVVPSTMPLTRSFEDVDKVMPKTRFPDDMVFDGPLADNPGFDGDAQRRTFEHTFRE